MRAARTGSLASLARSAGGDVTIRTWRVLFSVGLIGRRRVLGRQPRQSSGRDIAANCANCHGTDGRSRGVIPSLAGQRQGDARRSS